FAPPVNSNRADRAEHCFPARRSSDLGHSAAARTARGAKVSDTGAPSGSEGNERTAPASKRTHAGRASAVTTSAAGSSGSARAVRSEEHTSELQSRENLVGRLLLEKKK